MVRLCGLWKYMYLIVIIAIIRIISSFLFKGNLIIEITLNVIAGVIAVLGILKYKKLQKAGQDIPKWIFWVLVILFILIIILIVQTLIASIFLESFVGSLAENIEKENSEGPVIDREDLKNKREIREVIIEEALASSNVEKCYEIENDLLGQTSCISEVAKKLQDASLCKRISDDAPASKWGCIQSIAKEKQDASICDTFDEVEISPTGLIAQKGKCYRGVAIESNDPSICELIGSDTEKWICENNFS